MKYQGFSFSLFTLLVIGCLTPSHIFAQTFTVQNGGTVVLQNSGTLDLGSTTSLNENGGNVTGNGQIKAKRTLNAPSGQDVAGLGAVITSSQNLGTTNIFRGHVEQSLGNRKSIKRYYGIYPLTNSGLDATLTFNYLDTELNNLPEDDLTLFRSDDSGANYTAAGYGSRDASTNKITLGGIDSFARFSAAAPDLFNYGSLTLNGIDQYMDISAVADDIAGSSAISVSFWVKPDFANQTDAGGVVPVGLNDASGSDLFNILIGAPGTQDQVVRLFDSSGLPIITGSTLSGDTWHHIAMTYDNGTATLYVDGQSAGQSSISLTLSTDDQWSIGQEFDSGSTSDFLDGSVDEVRIWNKALSQQEIQKNTFQPLKGDETALLGYYQLNNTPNGSSTNSNDGSLLQNPAFSAETYPNGTFITGNEGWRMMTTPVKQTSYSSLLDTLWTQGFTGADETTGTSNVYIWEESSRQFTSISDASVVPDGSTGFITYVYDDQDYDGTPEGFPKMIKTNSTQRSGNVSPTLTYTDSGTIADDGWNLVGNPFGASIDWDAASGLTTSNLDASFYVWSDSASGGSGDYLSWNGSAGTFGGGEIAPWQGFWVKANATNPDITFTDEVRTSGGIFRKQKPVAQLRFTLNGVVLSSKTILMFSENATLEKDELDAYKLQSLNNEYLSLFTKLSDGTGLDINAIPASTEESMAIDLDIDGSSLGGEYELAWKPENLPEDTKLVLVDNVTGIETGLTEASLYSFELERKAEKAPNGDFKSPAHQVVSPEVIKAKSTKSRFTILLNASSTSVGNEPDDDIPATVELNQNYPNPFNPTTTIQYGVPKTGEVTMEVFNMLGQKVSTLINRENKQAGRYSVQFDARNLSSGLYLYRLKAGNTVITKKLTLIK